MFSKTKEEVRAESERLRKAESAAKRKYDAAYPKAYEKYGDPEVLRKAIIAEALDLREKFAAREAFEASGHCTATPFPDAADLTNYLLASLLLDLQGD